MNLLPRFYDVTFGAVRIDGHDVRDLTLASLREKIGLVAQDTFLFNDTVASNISYGRPEIGRDAVRRAAQSALADEFIERLPQGYDTVIGERGVKLSGGQRQRIAIARALLKNAPILILDEATSHLDTESEMLVQRALANLMADRTVIVIAHRISTIRRADKIVVMDRGRISEIGTHCRPGDGRRHLSEAARAAVHRCRGGGGSVSVRSMTGFAQVRKSLHQGEVVLSVKTVNHRGLDMHFHLPPEMDAFEIAMRRAIKGRVARGHLQLNVIWSRTNGATADAFLNRPLLEAYLAAFEQAQREFHLTGAPDLNVAFRIPGMFRTESCAGSWTRSFESSLVAALEEALDVLNQLPRARGPARSRRRFWSAAQIIRQGGGRMEEIRSGATPAFPEAPAGAAVGIAARIEHRTAAAGTGGGPAGRSQRHQRRADPAQDARGASWTQLVRTGGEIGKKLDFLLQEMNRETNTILSKTGGLGDLGLTITELALAAKSEIDKIREQSLNLE